MLFFLWFGLAACSATYRFYFNICSIQQLHHDCVCGQLLPIPSHPSLAMAHEQVVGYSQLPEGDYNGMLSESSQTFHSKSCSLEVTDLSQRNMHTPYGPNLCRLKPSLCSRALTTLHS